MTIANLPAIRACRPAWNKGRVIGQKRPLMPKHVWAIRVRLEIAENHRDLALFNLAIDSKLRGCDLVKLKVADIYASGQVKERASIIQSKTKRPVRFEITEGTRKSILRWMEEPLMVGSEHLWPGRFHERLHISTRQYARLVREWVKSIGFCCGAASAKRPFIRCAAFWSGQLLRFGPFRDWQWLFSRRRGSEERWSCFFGQFAALLRWIRVSHQVAILIGSVLLAWTSSGVKMPWVECGRSAL